MTETAFRSGLIAILRGVTPDEAVPVARAAFENGFAAIEVPLNSARPFESIARIRDALPADCAVGAGTVLSVADVMRAKDAGAGIIVSPNTEAAVISATVAAGMRSYPGVATPTEAFAAVAAGARSVKLFPSTAIGIEGMHAWRSVLPPDVEMLPVGGVTPENTTAWAAAGAGGAGIGSALYKPGTPTEEVARIARAFAEAWTSGRESIPPRRAA